MTDHPGKRTGQAVLELMRTISGQTAFLAAVIVASGGLVGYLWLTRESPGEGVVETTEAAVLAKIPLDGDRAMGYLKELCEIGPRPTGSEGMRKQQEYLTEYFEGLGGKVVLQKTQMRHPLSGQPLPVANLAVQWHPEAKERVLLCAHYDTRPFPDKDPVDPRGEFVGANDGASGVAVLMELAHFIPSLDIDYGVDFVLFDAEEFVFAGGFQERGEYFIGSTYFAEQYARARDRGFDYRWGVLLDMVGDKDLRLYHERNSLRYRRTRKLVQDIWTTARRLGVREFVARAKYEVRDDHLPLNEIAKIPTCDLIDFNFRYWHTRGDTPDKCSGESLAKVGWVVLEWLRTVR